MFSTKSQAAFDRFKAKYPPGHDYTTPGATKVDLISDLRQLARDVDVDIPADRIRLFYSDFRDQLTPLTERPGSPYGIVDNTDASMIIDSDDVSMRLMDAFGADVDIAQKLGRDLNSPFEIMSARYAVDAKGSITIVTEQAFVTPGDPEKSSILNRTEVKILLGQSIELDGVIYRNTDVPEINGISRSTLLGGTGERILPEAEYQKAFRSIEAIARAELEFINKAIGGGDDNSARNNFIEKQGFANTVTATVLIFITTFVDLGHAKSLLFYTSD
jgi:hypothetical protein